MRVLLWTLVVVSWWTATAWLGRQPTAWAAGLTTPAFVIGLVALYVSAWTLLALWSRDRRIVIFRAVAVTLAGVPCVAILEVPAAIDATDYRRFRAALNENWHGPAEEFIDDRELSFRHAPNARWAGRPLSDMSEYLNRPFPLSYQTFSTDSRGFRNITDRDRADIVLIGDSYIEGFHVSDDETVAVRLQELTGHATENLGMSGYGSLQELIVLRKYALPLEPHMIAWFFFEGNDLDDDQSFENALAEYGTADAPRGRRRLWSRAGGFRERSFTVNAVRQLRSMVDWLVPNSSDTFGWFRDEHGATRRVYFYDFYATREFGDYERDRFEKTKAAFREGAEICRARDIRLVVFYVPIKFRVYRDFCTFPAGSRCARWQPWDLESRFAAFCRDNGIEFMSLTSSMRRAAAGGRLLHIPEDSHWNPAGHTLVARLLADLWGYRP